MKRTLAFFCSLMLLSSELFAQNTLPLATNLKKAYEKQTRSITGSPGKSYWQNNADYQIKIAFDPASRVISGEVSIDYKNNSPDTLKKLVFKLYPNFFQQQAMRNSQVRAEDLTTGVDIKSVQVEGQLIEPKKQVIAETNMYIQGLKISPGSTNHVVVKFAYTLNKGSFTRTGQVDPGAFVIAYFFPRIAVYDDLEGWNLYPYLGKEEFYNDYVNFKVDITLPGDYQCWATGDLMNPDQVYENKFASLIKKASLMDTVTTIINATDIQEGHITKTNQLNTWRFEASNVTDFAFATSNHYVWKAASVLVDPKTGRRSRVDAVFNPDHKAYLPVIDYGRKTVELISYQFPALPFPYPHITVFEGLDAMEYPMMVNNLPFEGRMAVELTGHEIFHSLFPFFVGSNETKYSFLDEGWATFSELTFPPLIDPKLAGTYDIEDLNNSAGSEPDVPIMTLTPQLYGKARYSNKDLKPAIGFYYLKEMLGDDLFLKGIQRYISQWQGKHPTPYDFFACMNAGSGKDLNWFWRNWFFEKQVPDLAISKVNIRKQQCKIVVTNLGGAAVPVHLVVYYKDGSKKIIDKSIDCWAKGNKTVIAIVTATKPISKIILGKAYDADVNKKNNSWMMSTLP